MTKNNNHDVEVQPSINPEVSRVWAFIDQEPKVAIIDDDKLSSYNLNVKLKFIGETPVSFTSTS